MARFNGAPADGPTRTGGGATAARDRHAPGAFRRPRIAFVSAANNTANASSVTVAISPAAGETVVVVVAIGTTTSTVSSVKDSNNLAYTLRAAST